MPTDPAEQAQILFVPRLRGYLEEARVLNKNDYYRQAVTLLAVMTSTTTSGTDTYQVPNTHNMHIHGVLAHIAIIGAAASETEPMTAFADDHADNRLLTKAMNTRVTLSDQDSRNLLGQNEEVSLATLYKRPLDWRNVPHPAMAGDVLTLSVALIQTAAPYPGIDTEYGVTLDAVFIRVREG